MEKTDKLTELIVKNPRLYLHPTCVNHVDLVREMYGEEEYRKEIASYCISGLRKSIANTFDRINSFERKTKKKSHFEKAYLQSLEEALETGKIQFRYRSTLSLLDKSFDYSRAVWNSVPRTKNAQFLNATRPKKRRVSEEQLQEEVMYTKYDFNLSLESKNKKDTKLDEDLVLWGMFTDDKTFEVLGYQMAKIIADRRKENGTYAIAALDLWPQQRAIDVQEVLLSGVPTKKLESLRGPGKGRWSSLYR